MKLILLPIVCGGILLLGAFINKKQNQTAGNSSKICFSRKANACYGSAKRVVDIMTVFFALVLVLALGMYVYNRPYPQNNHSMMISTIITCVGLADVVVGIVIVYLRNNKCDYILYNADGFRIKTHINTGLRATASITDVLWSELKNIQTDQTNITIMLKNGKTMTVQHILDSQAFVKIAKSKILESEFGIVDRIT